MNYTYHYFGAYLEIKVQKVKRWYNVRECTNHHTSTGPFCGLCGTAVSDVTVSRYEYPTRIVSDLLPTEYESLLAEITPPQIFNTGVILARDNGLDIPDKWLDISPWSGETNSPILSFPTSDEISAMMNALVSAHADLIELIRQHPAVLSVEAKCGYVYCPEY